jgi:predicted ATPase/DNA-binding NarL/FixJ family response regulator
VGKTRLAVAVAEATRERFSDGVLFVELAAITDHRLVLTRIAWAVGILDRGADSVLERLISALRQRQMLLVLDNFEHVMLASQEILELLVACPGIKLLTTSRVALRVQGEREIPLNPLRVPDQQDAMDEDVRASPAIALFAERAEHVGTGFVLNQENQQTVAAICRQLDGIPLAIELAAPWLRTLSPSSLLVKLESRLGLLARGQRLAPDRQQTLRATLDWSYQLLTPFEQAVFRRCALFVGSWSLSTAEAICFAQQDNTASTNLLSALSMLVDHSLITAIRSETDVARFFLLETVREFALDRLEAAGELAEVQARLAQWSLVYSEDAHPGLFGPEQAVWLDRLEVERTTVRLGAVAALDLGDPATSLRIAFALGRFWLVRGHSLSDHEWLERAIEMAERHPDLGVRQRRAFALLLLGNSWFERGELRRAIETYRSSANAARKEGSPSHEANALLNLAIVSAQIGRVEAARGPAEEALLIDRELDNRPSMGKDLIILGGVLNQLGDPDGAQVLLEEALSINLELGDVRVVALNFTTLGEVARTRLDVADAARLFTQGRTLSDAIGEKRGSAMALTNLGWLALDNDQLLTAQANFMAAMQLRKDIGDRWNLAVCAEGFAAAIVDDHPAAALTLIASANNLRTIISGSPDPASLMMGARAQARLDAAIADAIWSTADPLATDDILAIAASVMAAESNDLPDRTEPGQSPAPTTLTVSEVPRVSPPAIQAGADHSPLSRREQDVLAMIVAGHQDREIAEGLFISVRTVSWHVTNILNKLGVHSRVAAAVLAIRDGLIDLSESPSE